MARRRTETAAAAAALLRLTGAGRRRAPSAATAADGGGGLRGLRGLATEARRVAVVGGGLTGLAAAHYLARWLPATARVTLYEAGPRLGGWVRTDREPVPGGGAVSFERGPRALSTLDESTWRFDDLVLYDLALELGLPLATPPDAPRYVYYPDRLVALPRAASLAGLAREPFFREALFRHTARGLVGLGVELLARRLLPGVGAAEADDDEADDDPSVAEWLRRITWHRGVGDHLASALLHGIYGGDVDRLSARCVLARPWRAFHHGAPGPGLRAVGHRQLRVLEALSPDARVRELALRPKGSLMHFGTRGMESLPRGMADALRRRPNVDVRTHAPVRAIGYDAAADKVTVTAADDAADDVADGPVAYDKVIAAIPSHQLARLTGDALPSLRDKRSVSLWTVNLWFPGRRALAPRGLGYLVPRSVAPALNPERGLGVFFDSDAGVAAAAEPPGTKLFVLLGGHYYDARDAAAVAPPADAAAAAAQARALVERHLGVPRAAPAVARARWAPDCIPQPLVGHAARMRAAHRALRAAFAGRLQVAGGSYADVGVLGALRAGFDAALDVAAHDPRATGLEDFARPADAIRLVHTRDITVRRQFVSGAGR